MVVSMLEGLPLFRKPLPILGHFLRRQLLVGVAVVLLSAFAILQLARSDIDHHFDQRVMELAAMIDNAAAISRTPEHLQFAVRELGKASGIKEIVIVSARTGAALAVSRAPKFPLDADGTTLAERLARAAIASGRFALQIETPGGAYYSVLPLTLAAFLPSGDDILATSHWSVPRWYGQMQAKIGAGHSSASRIFSYILHHEGDSFTLAPGSYSGVVVINSGDDWMVGMLWSSAYLVAAILLLVVVTVMIGTAWFFRFAVHRPLASFTKVIARMRESDAAVRQPMHGIREFDIVAKQWNDLLDAQARTEKALTRSEDQYGRLIDNLPGYVYMCDNDKNWTMRYVSASFERLVGMAVDNIIGNQVTTMGNLIHPDDRERVWISEQESLAAHRPCELQYRIITPSGTEKWVLDRSRGVYDADGNVIRLEGYIDDITALKNHTEDLLRRDKEINEQNERFNAALANMSQGLCLFDGQERLVVCNQRYASMYGLAPEQVKPGTPFRQILEQRIASGIYAGNIPEDYIQERCAAVTEANASTKIQELTDGRSIAISHRPLAGGGWLATHEDITTLKQHERELDAARLKAEAANRAKSAFIANTNHEMRTPLNAIVGFSEMLAAERFGPLGNPEYREFARLIESSGRSLLAIISTIMELSRLQSGDAGLDVEEIEPGEAVARIVRLWTARANARGIAVAFRNGARGVRLAADEQYLCKIVDNLVSNAVKFSRENSRVRVSLRLDARRRVVLAVADDGIGIAREHLDQVTQPFFQVDKSLGRDTGGIGLGLTVVRECASLHRASLDITSRPGNGTRVTVTFPAAATVSDASRRPRPIPRLPRHGADAGRTLRA
jgi:PAS domain S-box-containing protein